MDAKEFKHRYYPFHPKLYRVAYALLNRAEDAEDILQETYCKLWLKRDELTAIRQPEAFCMTLVKNLCLDFLRASARRKGCEPEAVPVIPVEVTPESELESKEQLAHIESLIDRLPEKQRVVLRMRGFGDCSLEEIETATGESAVNVRVLLSRARKTLKEMLRKQ
ncbi:MAG: sigma-70 family RNA polymerase sigma factor [Tannerella sp.]|jgi:RNA polymerase sigma-70 factor (ECF subfamily)|nr:sigma-70 family RNA polymerase sigma factor [Tannerella sp.]